MSVVTRCTIASFLVAIGIGCGSEAGHGTPPPDATVWFVDAASAAGIAWRCAYGTDETDYILETTGPGAAWFDYDDDGDVDIALVNKSGPFELLRNDTSRRGNWLRVVLLSRESAPHGIGARVMVVAGGKRLIREVRCGSSYGATEDVRPLFGLGNVGRVDSLVVTWPRGGVDRAANVAANGTVRILEAEGSVSRP